jgi:hypothetical protein
MNNYDFVFEYEYAYNYPCKYPLFWSNGDIIGTKWWLHEHYITSAWIPKIMLVLYNVDPTKLRRKQISFYRFLKKSSFREFTHILDCFNRTPIVKTAIKDDAQKYLSQEKLLYLKLF